MQERQETQVQSLYREDPLEEEMATHSSILAWRIPWTEEPGGLPSMGSQKSDKAEHAQHTAWGQFPGGCVGKDSSCHAGDHLQYRRPGFKALVTFCPL